MYYLMVLSRHGLSSDLTLQQLIWCEVLVVHGTRKESSVILWHGAVRVPQDYALRRLYSPHCTFSLPSIRQLLFLLGLSILCLASMWMCCVPIQCCLDDGRFAVQLDIRQLVCLKSAFLAEVCMDILDGLFHFQTHLRNLGCPCLRQSVPILRGMASTLWIYL